METRRRPSKRARASSKDVLAPARPAAERIPPKWRQHFNALVDLRERLLERRGVLVRDASEERPAYSLHMADAGTDNFDRDFALSIASSEQEALYEIDQAINRIRDGSYGVCELTGKLIEAERLKAIPWARFSAAAEQELERNGTVKRPKLGQLADLPKTSEPDSEDEEEE
jgi:RNA polymerase-binding transcription factor DksA